MGSTAMEALLGQKLKISKERGKWKEIILKDKTYLRYNAANDEIEMGNNASQKDAEEILLKSAKLMLSLMVKNIGFSLTELKKEIFQR